MWGSKHKAKAKLTREVEELRQRVKELEAADAERRQTEQDVLASREEYRMLVENLNDVVFTITPEGRFTYVSPVVERVSGHLPEEMVGRSLIDFLHPDDISIASERLAEIASGPLMPFEFRGFHKDGSLRHVSTSSRPVFEDGELVAITGRFTDITERKRVEEALRQSEEKYRSLFESCPDGIAITGINGKFMDANESYQRMLGYTLDELKTMWYQDLTPCHWREMEAENIEDLASKLGRGTFEKEYIGRDGTVIPISLTGWVITDAQGEPEKLGAFVRDVTERKRAEESLRDSEARYEALFNRTPFCVSVNDFDGKFIDANEALLNLLGYTRDEILSLSLFSFLEEQDLQRALDAVEEIRENGFQKERTEFKLRTKNGDHVWVETEGSLIFRNGRPYAIQGIARDITDRKRADEALKESEKRFRELADLLPQSVFEMDTEGIFTYSNRYGLESHGYTEEDLEKGMNAMQVIVPEERESVKENFRKILEGEEFGPHKYTGLRKDGSTYPVLIYSAPIIHDGKPVGIRGVAVDITEHVRAGDALRESEQLFAKAFHSSPNLMAITRLEDGRIVDVNDCYLATLGYIREELIGRTSIELGIHSNPEDRNGVAQAIRERGKDIQFEVGIRTKAGELRMVLLAGEVINIHNEPHLITVAIDITERKHIEMRQKLTAHVLEVLNQSGEKAEMIRDVLALIKDFAGFEAVGVRLKDGDDFPYYETSGFPAEFVEAENSLCALDEHGEPIYDSEGDPILECMCGNVICGRFDASLPFFTENGSFWTNSTTDLLASATDEDRQWRARNRCNTQGYESVALIPLHSDKETLGLLQLNDTQKNMFSLERIYFFERLSASIGIGLARKRAEEALQVSEANYRTIFDSANDAIMVQEIETGRPVDINRKMCEMVGHSRDELLNMSIEDWSADDSAFSHRAAMERIEKAFRGKPQIFEWYSKRKSGSLFWAEVNLKRAVIGGEDRVVAVVRDITDRKQAERERQRIDAQIQQAQKLESLGVLAGGIAHDFNNLLTGIIGNADLAMMDISAESPVRDKVEEISTTAHRAADLVRHLLAYSGRGKFVIEKTSLNELVREMTHLLEASISKKATIEYSFAADLPGIEADPTQIRQVIMNLITNASEALGGKSGVISASTGLMDCDHTYLSGTHMYEDMGEGLYVYLEVADTGCGMDVETRTRLFDPFFTTKFTGRGLGLAAVLGIVRSHGGTVKIDSEPDRGTTFRVLFPAAEGEVEADRSDTDNGKDKDKDKDKEEEDVLWQGSGTVLLVDDETSVRLVAEQMLKRAGFSVLTAADGREAVELYRERSAEITCVLLDLTMPHMDGEEAFQELRRIRADARVILSSGYSEEDIVERFDSKDLAGFVQKPYQYSNLIAAMRHALE